MKLLIAEDDAFFRRMLEQLLAPNYELQVTEDGDAAWTALQQEDAPRLALLDWVMPGLSGPQICRRVRANSATVATYVILLIAKNSVSEIISGLRAGADDYLTKPFDPEELRARVRVGQRVVELQSELAAQIAALRQARARENLLQHLLPVCPRCGAKRTGTEYWRQLESYLNRQREVICGQGACPCCAGEDHRLSSEVLDPAAELRG